MPKLTTFFALALAGLVAAASAGERACTKQADHRHRHADQILRTVDR